MIKSDLQAFIGHFQLLVSVIMIKLGLRTTFQIVGLLAKERNN